MALNWATIEDAVWDWYSASLASVASLPAGNVVWAYQSRSIPPRPCATLQWVDRDEVIGLSNRDEKIPVTGSLTATQAVIHRRMHTLQLDVYAKVPTQQSNVGKQAIAILGEVLRTLQLESQIAAFATAGLALRDVSDVRDLTQIVETGFESRASVDLTFSTVDQTTENVGKILTVTAPTGTFAEA